MQFHAAFVSCRHTCFVFLCVTLCLFLSQINLIDLRLSSIMAAKWLLFQTNIRQCAQIRTCLCDSARTCLADSSHTTASFSACVLDCWRPLCPPIRTARRGSETSSARQVVTNLQINDTGTEVSSKSTITSLQLAVYTCRATNITIMNI